MVVIDDANEQYFLEGQISSRTEYWIGLQEQGTKDTYMWVDSSDLVFGSTYKEYPWVTNMPDSVSNELLFVNSCHI